MVEILISMGAEAGDGGKKPEPVKNGPARNTVFKSITLKDKHYCGAAL